MYGFVVLYDQRSRHSMHNKDSVAGTAQRDTWIGTRKSATVYQWSEVGIFLDSELPLALALYEIRV